LLFRPHPLTPANIINQYLEVINKRNNILYVPENKYKDISLIDIFVVADIFIGDISSVLIDSILIDKPIILALDSKNVIDYCNICAFFKSILKKMVFFRHDPFKAEKVIEYYNPIKEIFEVVEKVNTDNAFMINQKVEKSLDKGIDTAAWDQVKNKFFYDTQGHSVDKMINFVESIF
jgi:CDP-glycerol glycerophosphotransferase (TagB/SpsB family)